MTTTQYQEDWFNSAVGRKTDVDGDQSFDCVDVPKDYAQHIWANTTWKDVWPQAGNACDMFWPANTSYVDIIVNDPNNTSQIPQRGDIIVYGGTKTASGDGINPYGHIATVAGADVNGVDVVQQDTYLQEPMTAGRLGYWNTGTGTALGWLRPKFDTPLAANQRTVGGSQVNERADAKLSAAVVRVIQPNTVETWKGYVRGDTVTVGSQSSNLWFKDDQGCASILFFDPTNVDGLPDLTPAQPPVLAANQRLTYQSVNLRDAPFTTGSVVKTYPADATGTIYDFAGYVHGGNISGNDVWFKGAYSDVYAWSGIFEDASVTGLPALAYTPSPSPSPSPTPLPVGSYMNAVDVSGNNKGLDLSKIDCPLAFVKASEGVGWQDPGLVDFVSQIRASGKIAVFYHYARPDAQSGNTAAAEADTFVQRVKLLIRPGDGVTLDWESDNVHDTAWARAWLDAVKAAFGALPLLYGNLDEVTHIDWSGVRKDYPLWLANYPAVPATVFTPQSAPSVTWEAGVIAFQYSDKGQVGGYSDVDLDVVYTDAAGFKAKYGMPDANPTPAPTPAPVPTPAPAPDPTPAPTQEQQVILAFLQRIVQWLMATFTKGSK